MLSTGLECKGQKVRTISMGKEVQRIGLGYARATSSRRIGKSSIKRWFGRQLERFGQRIQRASVSL